MAEHPNPYALTFYRLIATAAVCFLMLSAPTGAAFSDGGHAGPSVSQAPPSLPSGCGPREEALKTIKKFGEVRIGAGVAKTGVFVELYANPETGTWTKVVSPRPGISCFSWYGDGWRIEGGPGI